MQTVGQSLMEYNDNHIRDFEGAKGSCEVCGLPIELDKNDKPIRRLPNTLIWVIKCPHCNNDVRCYITRPGNVRELDKEKRCLNT